MLVYKCTCQVNEKIYVGYTQNELSTRWRDHVKKAKNGSKYPFHRAIRKHGADMFSVEIVQECQTIGEVLKAEQFWISELKTLCSQAGYNATSGGENGSKDFETRLRMKDGAQKRWSDEECRQKYLSYMNNRSLEHRAALGKTRWKAVDQLSLNGDLIATFASMREAFEKTGVVSSSISLCCNHKRIETAGGFKWRFSS